MGYAVVRLISRLQVGIDSIMWVSLLNSVPPGVQLRGLGPADVPHQFSYPRPSSVTQHMVGMTPPGSLLYSTGVRPKAKWGCSSPQGHGCVSISVAKTMHGQAKH